MPQPRTVLFIHHSNELYGADIVLLETIKGLDPARFRPFVLLPEDCRDQGLLAAEFDKLKIPYRFRPLGIVRRRYFKANNVLSYLLELAGAVKAIRKLIRTENLALVQSNTLAVCAGAFAARLSGVKHVWHIHEMLVSPRVVRKLLHFLAAHLSDSAVCISEAVRQHVLEDQPGFGPRLVRIYNGLPLENFVPTGDGAEVRRDLGIPTDAPLVGMIGRINHWKGQDVLAGAAKLLLDRFPDAYFLAVGSVFSDEVRHMHALTAEIDRLGIKDRFLISGFRRDVPALLSALDVYAHPSKLPEPFGLVVLEAMAASRPVVATAHGGPLEMIEDGVSGYLVEPGSATALADGIGLCLADRTRSRVMGIQAKERAFRMFHVSRYLNEMQDLYQRVLDGDQRGDDLAAQPQSRAITGA